MSELWSHRFVPTSGSGPRPRGVGLIVRAPLPELRLLLLVLVLVGKSWFVLSNTEMRTL